MMKRLALVGALLALGACAYSRPPLVDAADARGCEADFVAGRAGTWVASAYLPHASDWPSMQTQVDRCLRDKGYALDAALP